MISFEEDSYLNGGQGSKFTQFLSWLLITITLISILFDLFKMLGQFIYSFKNKDKSKDKMKKVTE